MDGRTFMCRLSMSRRVHDVHTCPLMLLLRHRGDMEKGVRAHVEGCTLDNDTMTFLDGGYDLDAGEFLSRPIRKNESARLLLPMYARSKTFVVNVRTSTSFIVATSQSQRVAYISRG